MHVFIENETGSRRKNIYDAHTLTLVHSVDVSAAYPGVFAHVPEVIDTYPLCEYRATGTQLQ